MLKYALLGLLAEKSRHGYDLKQAFERLMKGTWRLNIGQVYSTLARLERDGLVRAEIVLQDLLPNRKVYTLTDAGREVLEAWLHEPVEPAGRMRVDFFLKLLVARRAGLVDPCPLLWRQREVFLQALGELTPLLTADDEELRLLAEGLQLHLEADLGWLDRCEETFCNTRNMPER